jgi:hypothetical protein
MAKNRFSPTGPLEAARAWQQSLAMIGQQFEEAAERREQRRGAQAFASGLERMFSLPEDVDPGVYKIAFTESLEKFKSPAEKIQFIAAVKDTRPQAKRKEEAEIAGKEATTELTKIRIEQIDKDISEMDEAGMTIEEKIPEMSRLVRSTHIPTSNRARKWFNENVDMYRDDPLPYIVEGEEDELSIAQLTRFANSPDKLTANWARKILRTEYGMTEIPDITEKPDAAKFVAWGRPGEDVGYYKDAELSKKIEDYDERLDEIGDEITVMEREGKKKDEEALQNLREDEKNLRAERDSARDALNQFRKPSKVKTTELSDAEKWREGLSPEDRAKVDAYGDLEAVYNRYGKE